MFCPSCGFEEKQVNQFCRACGTDFRPVRTALEKTDNITASAANARDEIGRAIADKIRETESSHELKKIVEDVLPKIEKFLESPEERRLRRIRVGIITTFAGFGVTLAFFLASLFVSSELLLFAVPGLILCLIGVSLVINGIFHTVLQKALADNSNDGQRQLELDRTQTKDLILPEANQVFTSITEETTQHLREKQPVSRG